MTAPAGPVELAPDETTAAHPCADVAHYPRDLALMNYLLQDMRALIRSAAAGRRTITAHERVEWRVHDLLRRTIVCDPDAIVDARTMHVVGFFSDRAIDVDRTPLYDAEDGLLDRLRHHRGMLSYSSMELIDDHWANLVIHDAPSDRDDWRADPVHTAAVNDISPTVYNSVRIHIGCLLDGVVGSNTILLERSAYFDYQSSPHWQATRALPGAISERLAGPPHHDNSLPDLEEHR